MAVQKTLLEGDTGSKFSSLELLVGDVVQPEPALDLLFYVSLAGNDANDGSELRPVRTVQRALDLVPANGARYGIVVHPGVYPEDFALKPQCWILGVHDVLSRLAGVITLDPSWQDPSANNRAGFKNVQFRVPVQLNFRAALAPVAYLTLDGCSTVDTFELDGSDDNAFFIKDCVFSAELDISGGGVTYFRNCELANNAPLALSDGGPGTSSFFVATGGGTDGPMSVTAQATSSVSVELCSFGFLEGQSLTLTGAGASVSSFSAGSLPANLVVAGGAANPKPLATDLPTLLAACAALGLVRTS